MSFSKALIRSPQRIIPIAVLLFAAFIPIIMWMCARWSADNSYYSHGPLVPMVALLLIFRKKEALEKLTPEVSPWGLRIFVLGVVFYWASALFHVYFTSGFAMLIVITGLVLHFYGEKVFKEIFFPLLFLVFMVPLPIIVIAYICFKLKVLSALLATLILNLIGFPAVQLSSLIKLPHSYVLVEDSCGGLRSLISLAALGSIFAYRLRSSLSHKWLLFIAAIPIAVITNAFRIVFLSVVGEIWGAQYTQGPLHSISAYLVFAFAFLMLYLVKKLLE